MPFSYKYPRPALSVDIVALRNDQREVLLIQRKNDPYAGHWALPGGFLDMDETVEQGACRELKEETGLDVVSLEQLQVFSTVDRDPRERVVSVAFLATIPADQMPQAADDAKDARWFPIIELPELAFDHAEIIKVALTR